MATRRSPSPPLSPLHSIDSLQPSGAPVKRSRQRRGSHELSSTPMGASPSPLAPLASMLAGSPAPRPVGSTGASAFHSLVHGSASSTTSLSSTTSTTAAPIPPNPPLPSLAPFISTPLPPPPSSLALPEAEAFERETSIEKKKRRKTSANAASTAAATSSSSSSPRRKPPQPQSSPAVSAVSSRAPPPASSTVSFPFPSLPRYSSVARERPQPPATPMKTPQRGLDSAPLPAVVFRSPFVRQLIGPQQHTESEGQSVGPPTAAPPSSARLLTPSGRLGLTPMRPLFRPIHDDFGDSSSDAAKTAPITTTSTTSTSPTSRTPLAVRMFPSPPRPPRLSSFSTPSFSSNSSLFATEFSVLGELGRGDFGVVFLSRWQRDGLLYAVKRSLTPLRTSAERQRACREVEHFSLLISPSSPSSSSPHPSVVTMYQAWEEERHLYIQSEYLPQGTIRDALNSSDSFIAEERLWRWLADAVEGLHFLHSNGVLHLDIKPDNLFLTNDDGVKVGDLGTSARLTSAGDDDTKEGATAASGGALEEVEEGDAVYLAPELLDPSVGPVTAAADVFSLGLTMFELAADVLLPMRGPSWNDLRHQVIDWTGASYHEGPSESPARLRSSSPLLLDHAQPPVQEEKEQERHRQLPRVPLLSTRSSQQPPSTSNRSITSALITSPNGASSLALTSLPSPSSALPPSSDEESSLGSPQPRTPLCRLHVRARSTPSPLLLPSGESRGGGAGSRSPTLIPSALTRRRSSSGGAGPSTSTTLGAGATRSLALQSLISSMLARRPSQRPTLQQLRAHTLVTQARERRGSQWQLQQSQDERG